MTAGCRQPDLMRKHIIYIQILWFDELVVNVYEFAQFEFLEEC